MRIAIENLSVCVYCVSVIANGEAYNEDGDDVSADFAACHVDRFGPGAAANLVLDHSDDEPYFSWSSCDACGSTDGGDRFNAALLSGTPTDDQRAEFLAGYVTAILWVNAYRYDGDELVSDENATYAYVAPGTWYLNTGMSLTDAEDFLAENYDVLTYVIRTSTDATWSRHGHDFALTRNGHGAGFWDRGYDTDAANWLTCNAERYGEHNVITDDSPTVSDM